MAPTDAAPAVKDMHNFQAEQEATLQAAAARDRITQLNATNSPLLRLPAELRNQIYEYALGVEYHSILIVLDCKKIIPCTDIGLLFVCRQVNTEAALLPYALNRFLFCDTPSDMGSFVHSQPLKKLKAMNSISFLAIEPWFSYYGNGSYFAEKYEHPGLRLSQEAPHSD